MRFSPVFSRPNNTVQELHIAGRTQSVPADQRNLVLRAGEALADHAGKDLPFSAVLDKRIPAGSGLGGGSSDAATALVVLNALHQLDIPTEELMRVGSSVGSDVPMFVRSNVGSCRIRGRGEIVETLILVAAGTLRADAAGGSFAHAGGVCGVGPRLLAAVRRSGRPPARRDEERRHGWRIASTTCRRRRFRCFRSCGLIQQQAASICGQPVILTGSGSALFTAFEDAAEAQEMADRISEEVDVETLVVPFRTGAGNPLPEVQHADH